MGIETDIQEIKKEITPQKAFQYVAGTLVGLGATAAIVAALKGSVQTGKGVTKLLIRLGIFVLGCKAGDVAEKYFNETMQEIIKSFEDAREELKKNGSEPNE